jgi:ABC-2 type transport system ATP-binding protein
LEKIYCRGWRREKTVALRGVSLEVAQGEAFGFIGPNGAGKSTIIKILTGAIQATAGDAKLFDISVDNPEGRLGLGYVPENPYLYDYLSPLEILRMSIKFHRASMPDAETQCLHWLDRLSLSGVAKKPVRQFSKGMTQRVAIAQAMCINPKLLILDEPLSGLDPLGRRDVVELLSEYKHNGGTLFFTSHVLHDVERLADRFGLIHKGQLRAVRAPAELVGGKESVVVRSFGQRPVHWLREEFAGRWIGEVPRESLWECLSAMETAGHTLIEVRPALSLEAAFMQAVDAGANSALQ